MNKLVLKPNEEVRSELIRLCLDPEHPAIFAKLQEEVRQITNHIIRSRRDVKDACVAYARRNGLVEEPPVFPTRPQLPKPETPEQKKQTSEIWNQFFCDEKQVKIEYAKWLDTVFKAVKGLDSCSWRNDNYQAIRNMYSLTGSSALLRDTVERVRKTKRGKIKKLSDNLPLVWGNTEPVWTGSFYGDRRGTAFYDALVHVPGVGRIKGRLRRPLPGRPVQGVILTKKPDGWYASIKCVVTKRQLPEPVFQPIGVDVGQTDIVALSDGYTKHNPRDAEFVAIKAAIQEKGDLSKDLNLRFRCWKQVGRMDQNRKRRITYWINSELLPRLAKHSMVFVEKLTKNFKSDRGPQSCMHTTLLAIKRRLGIRVLEVDPKYTSQICSCCGSKEIVREGKYFACLAPECMATLDADVNAARNILARGLQLQAA